MFLRYVHWGDAKLGFHPAAGRVLEVRTGEHDARRRERGQRDGDRAERVLGEPERKPREGRREGTGNRCRFRYRYRYRCRYRFRYRYRYRFRYRYRYRFRIAPQRP